ncbi:metallophosphoesterase family protein [Aestuariibaculum suncheonense]|uniref:Phosphoesterase n=1 Tax=Aestuariibaculum suncheonense TaxID=1028745 RepID=A0A8J6Q6V1_9FLAO|nr:metallophosphoesterase family protein [Aestuariibaculum suncheonense]MBD0834730.1 metallophosphoesterase family protein [Aestuariibaculum suncheonense]
MTKILLLSDTHSYIDDDILKYVKQADEVWHAGDIGDLQVTDAIKALKPLRGVYGNIDNSEIRTEFPENNRFMCEGVDVWITHIGGYPNAYNMRVREAIKANPPKLFICGHSHILKVMPDKKLNLLHMNPGAVGKHGFHKMRTMLRFTIDSGKIDNLEVIEFDKRY